MTNTVQNQKLINKAYNNSMKNTGIQKNNSKVDFSDMVFKALDIQSNQQKTAGQTDSVNQTNKVNKKTDEPDKNSENKDTQALKPGEVVPVADLNTLASPVQEIAETDLDGIFQQVICGQENQNGSLTGGQGLMEMISLNGMQGSDAEQDNQFVDVNQSIIAENSLKSLKMQGGINENIDSQTATQNNLDELSKQFMTESSGEQKVIGQNNIGSDQVHSVIEEQSVSESVENASVTKTEDADDDGSKFGLSENIQKQVNSQETIKIKVAEPFRQVSPAMAENMGNKISHKIMEGSQEFQIQLMPENLGKISIKISILDTGIKVLLNCDNQKTLGLLADRADAIGQIVERNTNAPVVVEVKEDNYWNQQKNATDQHTNQNQSDQRENNRKKSDGTETSDFINQLRLGIYDNQTIA